MLESSTFNFPSTRNTVCYVLIKYNLCILWHIFYDYDSRSQSKTPTSFPLDQSCCQFKRINDVLIVDKCVATFKIDYEILTLQHHFC